RHHRSAALGIVRPRTRTAAVAWAGPVPQQVAELLAPPPRRAVLLAAAAVMAVDEAAIEPVPGAVHTFLAYLGRPLGYPLALDPTGRFAGGYGVQDQPWFVLTSASGKIVWKHDSWLPRRRPQARRPQSLTSTAGAWWFPRQAS